MAKKQIVNKQGFDIIYWNIELTKLRRGIVNEDINPKQAMQKLAEMQNIVCKIANEKEKLPK